MIYVRHFIISNTLRHVDINLRYKIDESKNLRGKMKHAI